VIQEKFINVPAQIRSELREVISAFHSLKLSMRKIVRQVSVVGKVVAFSSVHSVITQKKKRFRTSKFIKKAGDSPMIISHH
jgi:hypothetical protein